MKRYFRKLIEKFTKGWEVNIGPFNSKPDQIHKLRNELNETLIKGCGMES